VGMDKPEPYPLAGYIFEIEFGLINLWNSISTGTWSYGIEE
jgi:hypothetical protein